MPNSMGSNVARFPRSASVRPIQTELQLGPGLTTTIAILREIATLSEDNLVMQGSVHPDFRLIGLCAEALHLARQGNGIQTLRRERSNSDKAWTDEERADHHAMYEAQKALRRQVVAILGRARKIRATSAAGIYAKALAVTAATEADGFGASLAADLLACEGLRASLVWPTRAEAP